MSKSDDHFGEFEPHTRFKHRVLTSYFDAWGRILLLRQNAGNGVVYVDACAGRGADDAGNHGSPVLAARSASEAARQLGAMRNSAVNVQVIAIEKRPVYFKELQRNLAPYSGHARALQGTLADHIDAINAEFPDAPKLYFIDPFGLEPLDGATVRSALDGARSQHRHQTDPCALRGSATRPLGRGQEGQDSAVGQSIRDPGDVSDAMGPGRAETAACRPSRAENGQHHSLQLPGGFAERAARLRRLGGRVFVPKSAVEFAAARLRCPTAPLLPQKLDAGTLAGVAQRRGPWELHRTVVRTTLAAANHPIDAREVQCIERSEEWFGRDEAHGSGVDHA
jgi:hypothetical protein